MLSTLLGSFSIYADAPKDNDNLSEGNLDKGADDSKGEVENNTSEEAEAGEAEEEAEPEDVSVFNFRL